MKQLLSQKVTGIPLLRERNCHESHYGLMIIDDVEGRMERVGFCWIGEFDKMYHLDGTSRHWEPWGGFNSTKAWCKFQLG
jgi:hypothetical protein